MIPSAEELVRWVSDHPGAKSRAVASEFDVGDEDFDALMALLLELQRAGRILRVPSDGWEIPERTDLRVGVLKFARKGQGFVRVAPGSIREEDIYVRQGDAGTAFSGDLVLVRLSRRRAKSLRRDDLLREGVVVDVLERGRRLVRGNLSVTRGGGIVRPSAWPETEVFVPTESLGDTGDGEEVLVRLLDEAGRGGRPRGRVVVRRREEGTLLGDLEVIRELYGLRDQYAPEALREAESFEAISDGKRWPGRLDLRRERIFTIDPVDSKDFDDAISLERLPGGRLRLGVHIADVSHYVRNGSSLDAEAEKRGTSIYLPGHTVHMLPERIAGDLASLRPGEDRLAKSVLMTFDASGEVERYEIARSVIRSVRRFTYEEVLAILEWIDTGRAAQGLPTDHREYEGVLKDMARLRDCLHGRRRGRGALDLDMPSPRLALDERGEVSGIRIERGDPSHSLVEEFMLAANETVARHFVQRGIPLLSRAHAPPEERKLEELRVYVEALGFRLGRLVEARDLQHLVDGAEDDALSSVLQLAILRTMEHAAYVVGPSLHFALATSSYCHFTSPIRRYPDLIVHQLLDEDLDGKLSKGTRRRYWTERLPHLAVRTSELERRAEEAEREMIRLRLIRYLVGRIGERLRGRIVSLHPFGFFVRAEEILIDGMVPVASLTDDYYEFDRERLALRGRRGERTFRLGQEVQVELSNADPDLREITFRILDGTERAEGTPPSAERCPDDRRREQGTRKQRGVDGEHTTTRSSRGKRSGKRGGKTRGSETPRGGTRKRRC
jgi:ribonuclease R